MLVFVLVAAIGLLLGALLVGRRRKRMTRPSSSVSLRSLGSGGAATQEERVHRAMSFVPAEGDFPTPEEKQWVDQLRERVQGIADGIAGGDRWYEEGELLRYVRARATLVESEQLFREAMSTRCQQARDWGATTVDGSFGDEYERYSRSRGLPASGSGAPPAWWTFLDEHFPSDMYGSDRNGLPIAYTAVGRADMQGCVREVGLDALQRYGNMMNDFFLDRARAATQQHARWSAGAPVTGAVLHGGIVIVDLEGLSWRHLGEVKIFNRLGALAKVLHPERQRRCFIVRAPRTFGAVWRMAKPLLDARTVARITIVSSAESLQPLVHELGAENVPECLGGKHKLRRPLPETLVPKGAFQEHRATRGVEV